MSDDMTLEDTIHLHISDNPMLAPNVRSTESFYPTEDYLRVKFGESVKVSTLINENFTVHDLADFPNAIPNPFKKISIFNDWISTSRQLTLWWNFQLLADHIYRVEILNLETPFNTYLNGGSPIIIDIDVDYWFPTTPPGPPGVEDRPTREVAPLDVEDYSIKNPPFTEGATDVGGGGTGGGGAVDTTKFGIVSVTPTDSESYQLPPQANEGKIVVEFTKPPAANYLNNSDFKVQRKLMDGVKSWENVATKVLADSTAPKVNIYLPSQGSIPTYSFEGVEGADAVFWVDKYKYRLIISKYVGV